MKRPAEDVEAPPQPPAKESEVAPPHEADIPVEQAQEMETAITGVAPAGSREDFGLTSDFIGSSEPQQAPKPAGPREEFELTGDFLGSSEPEPKQAYPSADFLDQGDEKVNFADVQPMPAFDPNMPGLEVAEPEEALAARKEFPQIPNRERLILPGNVTMREQITRRK